MASSIMHLAIAGKINKKINKSNKMLFGSIAPDIEKIVYKTKDKSHFLFGNEDLPDLKKFLIKYRKNLSDDFVLGYYIHLYTDYLWQKYFITEINNNDKLLILDGNYIDVTNDEYAKMIYNDYTSLDIQIIEKYNLNLNFIYEELPKFDNKIDEIEEDKLYLLIERIKNNVKNSKRVDEIVFNIDNIEQFIDTSCNIIISEIEKLEI